MNRFHAPALLVSLLSFSDLSFIDTVVAPIGQAQLKGLGHTSNGAGEVLVKVSLIRTIFADLSLRRTWTVWPPLLCSSILLMSTVMKRLGSPSTTTIDDDPDLIQAKTFLLCGVALRV
jgi:hypothetical protein